MGRPGITVEGKARVRSWDDTDPETMRRLLREIYVAAGGTHDDWEAYDRAMREERRAAVVVVPERIYALMTTLVLRRVLRTAGYRASLARGATIAVTDHTMLHTGYGLPLSHKAWSRAEARPTEKGLGL